MADVNKKETLVGKYITWPINGGTAFGYVYGGSDDGTSCAVNLPNGQLASLDAKQIAVAKVIEKSEFDGMVLSTIDELNKLLPAKGENMSAENTKKIEDLQKSVTEALAAKDAAESASKVLQSQTNEWENKFTASTAKIAELEKTIKELTEAKDAALAKIAEAEKAAKAKVRFAEMKEAKAESLFGEDETAILKAFADMDDTVYATALKVAQAGAKKLTEVTVTNLPKSTDQKVTSLTGLTEANDKTEKTDAEIVAEAKVEKEETLVTAARAIDTTTKDLLQKFFDSRGKKSKKE